MNEHNNSSPKLKDEFHCVSCIFRRAANAARAMAAMTSSTMAGVFPPIGAAIPMIPQLNSITPSVIPAKSNANNINYID